MKTVLDLEAEALRILAARAGRATLAPITDRTELSITDAYVIQALLTKARVARGERVIGWKLGYTSLVMRQQMGIDSPNFGPLTDAMLLEDGGLTPQTMTQPRVEPEIALRFARDVPSSADRAAVLDCVGSAHACLEIVDSVWNDYRFKLEDNTADGSSAAGVVLGPELSLHAIDRIEVSLWVDGEPAGVGVGSDASGHPADGVVWLVAQLAARNDRLRAGDVVITGGLTRAAPLMPGSVISARFACDPPVKVSVRRG